MPRTKKNSSSPDSFDAFLSASDVEQVYIVLSLAKQSHGNDLGLGVQQMLEQPTAFARAAVAHQDRIAKRHYGIAMLFGVIVLAMVYVMYQGFTTPDVGVLGVLLPAMMACFALWRMERSVHRGRQGNLMLLRLLDALDGQPYSYDAAAFTQFLAKKPELQLQSQRLASAETMALKHLAALKWEEIGAHTR
ncbi:MAG TPA: hypothetical protein VIG85_11050 [Comamonas sp.]